MGLVICVGWLGLGLVARWGCRLRPVECGGGDEMLDNGAIDCVFVRWLATAGGRLRNDLFQDRVLLIVRCGVAVGWRMRTMIAVFQASVFVCS